MSGRDEGKQPSGYKLTGVALAILVMGLSLTAVIIAYLSYGHIGSSFSTGVLQTQQEELRKRYGLPPLPPVTPQEAEIPPSLRNATTIANENSSNSTT
jgi:hypothetical protein